MSVIAIKRTPITGFNFFLMDGPEKTPILSKLIKAAHTSLELAEQASVCIIPYGKEAQKALGTTWTVLGIVALPSITHKAIESLGKFGQNDTVPWTRKALKALKETMKATSVWGKVVSSGMKVTPVLGTAFRVAEFTSTAADLKLAYDDYYRSSALLLNATGDREQALIHTKWANQYRIAANIASLAIAILGLAVFFAGIEAAVFITAASLVSQLISIRSTMVVESGEFELIKF